MRDSIVYKLIKNDFKINKSSILLWLGTASLGILISILFPGLIAANIGFSLIISAIIGGGIQLMMNTVVFDHIKGTQLFVMSLPLNFKQYIIAKLLLNFMVFFMMWSMFSTSCLYILIHYSIFPMGSIPFITTILMSILPVYCLILSVCVIKQSIGLVIATSLISSFLTSAFFWWIINFESIGSHLQDSHAVWNESIWLILISQTLFSFLILFLTMKIQLTKKDFYS